MIAERSLPVLVGLVAALLAPPASLAAHPTFTVEPYEWEVAKPEEEGLPSWLFSEAFKEAKKRPYSYSLLVVRNGRLIAERYFHGHAATDATYLASATKSFLSALVGQALELGYLQSLDQRMMDFFPEYAGPSLDPRKYDITLRHLLQMRAGYPYDSTDSRWRSWMRAPDRVGFAVELDLEADPGSTWAYSSASTHILSAILVKATGMDTDEFARRHLFEPLGIALGHWGRDPQGIPWGGWDMYVAPRDLARFGSLYLDKGAMDGAQILPESWIRKSKKRRSDTGWDWGVLENSGYGMLWWLGELIGYEVYYAQGHGGQNILNVPKLDLVIVTTCFADNSFAEGWYQSLLTTALIGTHVLLPIRDELGPAPHAPRRVRAKRSGDLSGQADPVDTLRWRRNRRNREVEIEGYRIYALGDSPRLLAEVGAGSRKYQHRGPDGAPVTLYGLTAVTDGGEESLPAVAYVH
jgi:CubicO group peptidase (beta-lactamase class C family)